MVGIVGVIALLYCMHKVAELELIEGKLLYEASLCEEVECQKGQRVAGCLLSQPKDVKLPVSFCILQAALEMEPGCQSYCTGKHLGW